MQKAAVVEADENGEHNQQHEAREAAPQHRGEIEKSRKGVFVARHVTFYFSARASPEKQFFGIASFCKIASTSGNGSGVVSEDAVAVSHYADLISDYVGVVSDYVGVISNHSATISDYIVVVSHYSGVVSDYSVAVSDYSGAVSHYVVVKWD
jgi:calcineurin-like phosphoesterase